MARPLGQRWVDLVDPPSFGDHSQIQFGQVINGSRAPLSTPGIAHSLSNPLTLPSFKKPVTYSMRPSGKVAATRHPSSLSLGSGLNLIVLVEFRMGEIE
jgi:hypothetical protein